MNKEAMQQQILEALSKRLGNIFHISVQRVFKTNRELDALMISQDKENIVPTIYLDPFYRELEDGTPVDDVCNMILERFFSARSEEWPFDLGFLRDLNSVRNRLYVQLINRHSNERLLHDIPHSLFLDDFAVTVRCIVGEQGDCRASFLVHNNNLDIWQTDAQTILSDAVRNTRRMLGVELMSMGEFFQKMVPEIPAEPSPLWILTNRKKLAGASTVLFDDILKDFAAEHGNFYVIFSSIHELLLIPTPDDSNIDEITKMNQQVNEEQVGIEEVLGTKAYYYSKDRGFVL